MTRAIAAGYSSHVEFRALIIDDEETYARALMRLLGRRGIAADHAASAAAGLDEARRRRYDLVLLDYLLPDGSGLDLIPPLRALAPPPQVLMMTAFGTIENAVEAMRRGAFDYLTKTTALEEVVERVLDARRFAEAREAEERRAQAPFHAGAPTGSGAATRHATPATGTPIAVELLGDSAAMQAARARIREVAASPETTVLLTGESGSGKGVAARMIHALSPRAADPFVAIDCVALPATLAESELFGHEKGAFTGADRQRAGKFEQAAGGTVLLDEIGDMELALQGKLLRVLEERAFDRVGGRRPVELAARVVAASHRDLAQRVEEGRFRLDLFHRLSVFPIAIPPLRERGDDVVLLADHFARTLGARMGRSLAPPSTRADVVALLRGYDFPGNVRELKNVVERALILAAPDAREITPDLLPPRLRDAPRALEDSDGRNGTGVLPRSSPPAAPPSSSTEHEPPRAASPSPLVAPMTAGASPASAPSMDAHAPLTVAFQPGRDTLDDLERRLLEEALRLADGKKARAAELLGISRYALLRRVEKYGL